MSKVPEEARQEGQKRREVRVEGQVDRPGVLVVQRSYDCFCDSDGLQARHEEAVQPVLGEAHGREERRHNVPRYHEGCADGGGLVLVIELVAQRLVQRDERGF